MPSTTDYNGVYKGYYIDFEAKEVRTKAFSLTNIHEHQLKHLFDVREQGGIAFIIVRFSKIDETYMLDSKVLNNIIKNGEKSISLDYFKKNGCLVKTNYHPRLDYINSINMLYFGGKNEHKKNIE
jgi:recombination protein U